MPAITQTLTPRPLRRFRQRPRQVDALLAIVLIVLSVAWSINAMYHAPQLSRLDEWTYIDYSWKISAGHIPVRGEALGLEARTAWSCRGMEGAIRKVVPPACSEVASHAAHDWPFNGENYNAFHPPFFFLFTGLFGRAFAFVTGAGFVTGARVFCALVLACGIAALYFAIRAWRVRPVAAFAGALVVLATPAVAASGTMVHSESANALAGAAAVWIGARIFVQHKLGWVVPSLVALAITLTRVVSTVGIICVLAMVALSAIFPKAGGFGRSDRRKLVTIVVVGLIAIFGGYFAWSMWQNARTPTGYVPAINGLSTSEFTGQFAQVIGTLIAPYGITQHPYDWYMQDTLVSDVLIGWSNNVLYWFYIALPWVGLLAFLGDSARRLLAGSAAIGPFVAAVVVQGRELLTNHSFFRVLSGRYAMAAVPLFGATAASLFDRKILRWVLLGFGLASYAVVMASPWLPLTAV